MDMDNAVDRLLWGLLFIALLCLKLTVRADLSWWWVISPLLALPTLFVVKSIWDARS